jgi:hypothetical protein
MLHDLWDLVTGGMMSWYEAKMFIEHASLFSSDALHVIVGVLLWVLAAVALGRRLADWLPWLILAILLVLNEGVDLWVERWPDAAMQYGESAKDLLLTLALPTGLMALARLRPDLFSRGRRQRRR